MDKIRRNSEVSEYTSNQRRNSQTEQHEKSSPKLVVRGREIPQADTDKPNLERLQQIIARAQPRLSPETQHLLTTIEATKPTEPYPLIREELQFPKQAEHLLDRMHVPQKTDLAPDIKQAYRDRCTQVQQLWQQVHPASYARFMEKPSISLYPMGNLERPIETQRSFVTLPLADTLAITGQIHGQRVLFVDANRSPAEMITRGIGHFRQAERYVIAFNNDNARDVYQIPIEQRYERIIEMIEINHRLGEHALPKRHIHLFKEYQTAYNDAIADAYKRGSISMDTPHANLQKIGEEAGRKKIWELTQANSSDQQLYPVQGPENLPSELQQIEKMGIKPIPLNAEFIHSLKRGVISLAEHSTENPQPQTWLWSLTAKGEIYVLPRWSIQREMGDKPLVVFHAHTQASQGEPVIAAGELTLKVQMPSSHNDQIRITADSLTNQTGHFAVSDASFAHHLDRITTSLQQCGIDTNQMTVDYMGTKPPSLAERRMAMLQRLRNNKPIDDFLRSTQPIQ